MAAIFADTFIGAHQSTSEVLLLERVKKIYAHSTKNDRCIDLYERSDQFELILLQTLSTVIGIICCSDTNIHTLYHMFHIY